MSRTVWLEGQREFVNRTVPERQGPYALRRTTCPSAPTVSRARGPTQDSTLHVARSCTRRAYHNEKRSAREGLTAFESRCGAASRDGRIRTGDPLNPIHSSRCSGELQWRHLIP